MIIKNLLIVITLATLNISGLHAEILDKAELVLKINLKKAPTSRPQTVAYIPVEKKYYIADGGLAPMGTATEAPVSKSLIHTYDETGKYIESTRAGFDNRSIYFNQKEAQLETISYNVSSAAGFAPMTGIFSLELDDNGLLTGKSSSISGFAAAMGSAGTMPSFNSKNNIYYAKQEKTNEVFVVDAKDYKLIETIKLDFTKPKVEHHDVASHFVAYTEKKGEELILLDVDHKRFLIYDKKGNYKGESKLPKTLKIRAQNHFNGLGYTINGYYFIYIDSEGEHGSYHAYKVLN
jgi:hypothetical protein